MKPQIEPLEPRRLLSDTWKTVDDYQYAHPSLGTRSTSSSAITVDSSGHIYAAGRANTGTSISSPDWAAHELVRKSSDGGASWSLLSDYVVPGARSTNLTDIELDAAGNLFLTGAAGGSSFVRRSSDAGQTWTTIDSLPGVVTNDLTIDAAGNLYTAGTEPNAASGLVRRSTDGGNTWSTVDSFSKDGWGEASAVFVHPAAGIFVAGAVGYRTKQSLLQTWVVRRSRDGGATWATVDSFQLNSKYGSYARALGADAAGNLYVVGDAGERFQAFSRAHWIVRKSTNGGTTWTTADHYQRTSSTSASASHFARDTAGNLFVAGIALAPTGGGGPIAQSWIVRSSSGGVWTTTDDFQLTANADAVPNGIAADGVGGVFVAGSASDGSSGHWVVRRTPPVAATLPFATSSTGSSTFNDANSSDDPTLAEELLGAAV